jgi:hypothetical protein
VILPAGRRQALTAKAQTYAGELDRVAPYLLGRGISLEAARMFALGYVTEGEFDGRLSIPYITPGGVVQIKYRCTDSSHEENGKHTKKGCPKYLYEAGTGLFLYNAQVLIHSLQRVVIVEGELDAICVQAYAGIPTVAYPGADTWEKRWRHCFEGVSEVIVVADGDQPGKEAARKVADTLGFCARVVTLPAGDDSNSYIATHGAGSYLERLQ